MKISKDLLNTLNHWRNELLNLDKTYYSKNLETERIIKNMLNKCLDDVIENNKETSKIKCNAK